MVKAGDRAPEAEVWTGPHQPRPLAELAQSGRVLLLFYLFDWSST